MSEISLIFDGNIHLAKAEQVRFESCLRAISQDESKTKIIVEVYQSEVSYILQIEILIKFFMWPVQKGSLLTKDEFQQVFGNIYELYSVNKELLAAIKSNPCSISQAFKTMAPFLKAYSVYAHGYRNALLVVQRKGKQLSDLVKQQETRPEVGTKLISLLISPVQRVPRYRLLLQSLLEATLTTDNDYQVTKEALSLVEETAWHINFFMSEAESGEAMVQLAFRLGAGAQHILCPGRKLIKQGTVRKAVGRGLCSQRRFMALFSDILLVCRGKSTGPLRIVQTLPLTDIAVDRVLGPVLFRVSANDKEMLFYTSQSIHGEDWVAAIDGAISNCQNNSMQSSLLQQSSLELEQGPARFPMIDKGTQSVRSALSKYKKIRAKLKPLKRCQNELNESRPKTTP